MKLSLIILALIGFTHNIALADLNDMVSNDGILPIIIDPANTIEKGNKGAAIIKSSLTELEVSSSNLTPAMVNSLNRLPTLGLENSPSSKAVIGIDTRAKIFANTYPMRAIALITVNTGQIYGKCTGSLINANTVITAGHCVHQGQNGTWYPVEAYTVYPGYDGSIAPYGQCTVKRLYSTIGWTVNSSPEHDYAALKLNCSIGKTTGWFGFGIYSTTRNLPAIVNGYPSDKIGLWGSADIVSQETDTRIYYKTDTSGGMSGSPVWYDSNYGPMIIAIHAYQSGILNSGVRINSKVFKNLKNWKLAK